MKKCYFYFLFFLLISFQGFSQQVINAIPVQTHFSQEDFEKELEQAGIDLFAFEKVHMVFSKASASRAKVAGAKALRFVSFYCHENQEQETAIALLKATELFQSVEADVWGQIASTEVNDPGMSLQWYLDNKGTRNGAKAGADIRMKDAWDFAKGDEEIIMGFVDTGVKTDHPDLNGRVWNNATEIANDGIDNDENGYIDDMYGWNTYQGNNDIADRLSHGTQINGIVGANSNNSMGFAGMDWHCKLINVRGVNDQGQGITSWWAEGIYYLVDNGAHVINLSLGSVASTEIMEDAVTYAHDNDVTLVAATGNANVNNINYPAAYETVIAVGATDHADDRALWNANGSNYGPEIDVVAPGKAIYGINSFNTSSLQYVTAGTSQATPQVAALASLMLSLNPDLSPDSIAAMIIRFADDQVGPSNTDVAGWDEFFGHGRINAYETLKHLSKVMSVEKMPLATYGSLITSLHHQGNQLNITVGEAGTLKVLGIDGSLMYQSKVAQGNSDILMPELPRGTYILFIENETRFDRMKFIW